MNHHNLLKQHSNEMIHLSSTLIYFIPNKFLFSLYDGVASKIEIIKSVGWSPISIDCINL